ncbi:Elongator complex protein 1 [Harpegnathos saltator]|uniref:Elongator complex protein 1 n=1 Tax=Harpegnathos saltator TaxID=610380 RepID=E2B9H7_HARSA|nr:Elongator complex protein 1 [Harpegnathos saltator]
MKNLVVYRQYRKSLTVLEDIEQGSCEFSNVCSWKCTVNPVNEDLYILLGTRLFIVPVYDKHDINVHDVTYKDSKVVGFEYSAARQQLYCAYDNGDIAKLDVTSKYPEYFDYEIVASYNGLKCMALSPDHEIMTVVTGNGILITIISNHFLVISQVDLHSSDFGKKQFITVGWGKKDTQFHGSEGKAAAKAKPEQICANESDDGIPKISWRGDGALFAVSFLHAATKIRQFKIFDREGTLQYTSEPTNGLEECLAWKPSGSLIAVSQRLNNKLIIALFEKNGLKHREFSLPFETKEVTVKDLFWSPDSQVLAVTCEESDTKNTILQLWTENNYHCRGKTVDDKAVVGVIDGKKILITSFKEKVIPPPMAHQYLQVKEAVNAIIFAPDVTDKKSWINSNIFCTVSCNDNLTFFRQDADSPATYKVFKTYNLRDAQDSDNDMLKKIDTCSVYTMHHFLWHSEDIMLCSKGTFLCILSLADMNSEEEHITVQSTYIVDDPIEHIIPSPDASAAYVITNKSVLIYTIGIGLVPTNIKWTVPCCHVEAIKIGSKHFIIGLSHFYRFLIDGNEVCNNIISFYVHSEFLLLTTLQNTLICIPLNERGMKQLRKFDLTIKPWKHTDMPSFADINIGRVESGSEIITAVSRDSKTILQMPRGNLECINPRPLLLRILGFHLDDCDYRTAIDFVKKHHINPNLIYDYNPQLFMNNAEKFVEDNGQSSWLCRFLSELQDEDVSVTLYASCYQDRIMRSNAMSRSNEPSVETKVDKICRRLRDVMEKRDDASDLIQPILLSLMKNKQGVGLQLALGKLKEVIATEDSVMIESAFACLQFATNMRVMYDTALGMYECELAMFIASKSQMDPKEYIPFLRALSKLEENFMKYSIDMHLHLYDSALVHLSKVPGKFEECLSLIRDHKLHAKAIQLFEQGSAEYKKIAEVFGEHLLSKKMYSEAAIMFCRSEDFQKALDAHKSAGNWQDCIIMSTKLNLSPADSHELYREIVERLKADRKYQEAAEVLRYYLNDAEEAVALLCEGRCWKHAIRIAHDVRRLDLNDTHILPEVKEHAEHTMTQLHKATENFVRYKSRLSTVRAEMSARQTSATNELMCHDEPTPIREVTDFLSDASSVAGSAASQRSRMSTASGRSYRSSKNRRKQERKLFSLKKGSMFEDLGLIHALYEIISNTCKRRDEMSEHVKALVHFGLDDYAAELQDKMQQFFKLLETSKAEIWDRSAPTSLSEMERMATYAPAQLQEVTAYLKLVDQIQAKVVLVKI